jgi:hypothetical protein
MIHFVHQITDYRLQVTEAADTLVWSITSNLSPKATGGSV